MNDHDQLLAVIEALRAELRALHARVGELETRLGALPAPSATGSAGAGANVQAPQQDITEEELLALSAAVAAYFGVRARIRHVRVVHSATWAQVGRVHIQASHRVH